MWKLIFGYEQSALFQKIEVQHRPIQPNFLSAVNTQISQKKVPLAYSAYKISFQEQQSDKVGLHKHIFSVSFIGLQ